MVVSVPMDRDGEEEENQRSHLDWMADTLYSLYPSIGYIDISADPPHDRRTHQCSL